MEVCVATQDEPFLGPLKEQLEAKGLSVRVERELGRLSEALAARPSDALVLDLDVSEGSAWETLRVVRSGERTSRLPVIVVSGRHTGSSSVITALRMGAVEYVLKPCEPRVLVARLQAILNALERRRRTKEPGPTLRSADGAILLDTRAHRCLLQRGGSSGEAELTSKEFRILEHLLERKNCLVSKDELAKALWPGGRALDAKTNGLLAQHMAHLRSKLGPLKGRLRTVWGLGYRLDDK